MELTHTSHPNRTRKHWKSNHRIENKRWGQQLKAKNRRACFSPMILKGFKVKGQKRKGFIDYC